MVTRSGAAAAGTGSGALAAHGTAFGRGRGTDSDLIELFFQIGASACRAFGFGIKAGEQQFKFSLTAAADITEYRHN